MEKNKNTIEYFREKAVADARAYFGMDAKAQAEFIEWFNNKVSKDIEATDRTRRTLEEAQNNLTKAEKYRRDEMDIAKAGVVTTAVTAAGMMAGNAIGEALGDSIIGMGLGAVAGGLLGSELGVLLTGKKLQKLYYQHRVDRQSTHLNYLDLEQLYNKELGGRIVGESMSTGGR